MLSIRQQEPGVFTASDGGRLLGSCRFSAQGERTLIHSLSLQAPDRELCDGLLRAVLFHGLRLGRPQYRFEEQAAAPFKELLKALGIPEEGEVGQLPHRCQDAL